MEQSKLEEIKKRVTEIGLRVSRIPEKAKKRFIEIANDEFAGDYGMTIKFLVDFRDGVLIDPNEKLTQQIEALAEEIAELKVQHNSVPQAQEIRMASGRIVKLGGKENGIESK